PSAKHVLFSANYTKQYGGSYSADYYIWNVEAMTLIPLVEGQSGDVQYAEWSPHGNVIAYVRGMIYLFWRKRITEDKYSLWFSPDGEYLAFSRGNETEVLPSTLPRYMAGQEVAPPHPEEHVNNPSVTRKVDIQTYTLDNMIITEVAWVAEKHERVIIRTQSRTQDTEKLVLVDVESGNARVVRERNSTDGWLDRFRAITYVPGLSTPSYLDISDHSGWAHIYLYPVAGGEPIALTSGNWEVTTIYSVDTKRGLTSPRKGITILASPPEGGTTSLAILDQTSHGKNFAAKAPDTPIRVIDDNASLKKKLSEYDIPKISWSTLKHPDGYELNFMERLPPKFRKGEKYPVLFDIYGGPGVQWTEKIFRQKVEEKKSPLHSCKAFDITHRPPP
ncbi:hypothetical protein HOY82DRAFT_639113, partial [Tuber indicum]